MRPTLDEMLFKVAYAVAERSTCSRLQVGAVIARSGRIISTGYNGAASGEEHCHHEDDSACPHSVHAEANAVVFAARHGVSTTGTTLYLTHSPCFSCAGLILNAGISAVMYQEEYRDTAGAVRLNTLGVPATCLVFRG